MNEVRESYARPARGATFPFDASVFDPPKVKSKSGKPAVPKVTARGTLIRDDRERMQVVPDFETVLANLRGNNAEIGLPMRTVSSELR